MSVNAAKRAAPTLFRPSNRLNSEQKRCLEENNHEESNHQYTIRKALRPNKQREIITHDFHAGKFPKAENQ